MLGLKDREHTKNLIQTTFSSKDKTMVEGRYGSQLKMWYVY